jgi:hypothetical protein
MGNWLNFCDFPPVAPLVCQTGYCYSPREALDFFRAGVPFMPPGTVPDL